MHKELIFLYEFILELMDKGHIGDHTKREEVIARLESLKTSAVQTTEKAVTEVETAVETAKSAAKTVEGTNETTSEEK